MLWTILLIHIPTEATICIKSAQKREEREFDWLPVECMMQK